MSWSASDFGAEGFVRALRRPPAQTGIMTAAKFAALIKAGYGQGHFTRYKPWLRVTKHDYSPNSLVGRLPGPDVGRHHHPRAIGERRTIQISKWLGAVDVRDAYPVWAFEHEHPGVGLPGFDDRPRHPGLSATAKEANIRLGVFAGTDIPYVATIDILTTWKSSSGRYHLVAMENKPESIARANVLYSRAKERLELVRRYCMETKIRHRVIHAEKLPIEFCANIDIFEPTQHPKELEKLIDSHAYRAVVDCLKEDGYCRSANELLHHLQVARGYADELLTDALYAAIWRQDIDHDITQPWRPWERLRPGGVAFRRALTAEWVGDLA